MSKIFVGSIDLSKIDKTKIVSTDKDGNPFASGGKYYNVVVWVNDTVDQYGNIGSIQTSSTKEERESGVKPAYLGNFKNVVGQNTTGEPSKATGAKDDDDLPF